MFDGLSPEEKHLIAAVMQGTDAVFVEPENVLQADRLSALILRSAEAPAPPEFFSANCPRWVIDGARIEGRLRLRDGRLPGGAPLPALEFVRCTFEDGFNAGGAHFRRLRFEDCDFEMAGALKEDDTHRFSTPLILRNVVIDTELRIDQVRGAGPHGLFWFYAEAIRVGTNIRVSNTVFRAPLSEKPTFDDSKRYALNLNNANIGAELVLQPAVVAKGGVNLRSATIGGDVWAEGLRATDGETPRTRFKVGIENTRHTFNGQSARIGGNFMIRSGQKAVAGAEKFRDTVAIARLEGDLHLWGLQLQGGLYLSGLAIVPRYVEEAQGEMSYGSALTLKFADIAGDVRLDSVKVGQRALPFEAGSLYLTGAQVGSIFLDGCIKSIEAIDLEVKGDAILWPRVTVYEASNDADVELSRSVFHGVLNLGRLGFLPRSAGARPPTLRLRGSKIHSTLGIGPYPHQLESVHEKSLLGRPGHSILRLRLKRHKDATRTRWEDESEAWIFFLCKWGSRDKTVLLDYWLLPQDEQKVYPEPDWSELQALQKTAVSRPTVLTQEETKALEEYHEVCRICPPWREIDPDNFSHEDFYPPGCDAAQSIYYAAPYCYGPGTREFARPHQNWNDWEEKRLLKQAKDWSLCIEQFDGSLKGAIVDLRDASCESLDDVSGSVWKDATVYLDNFTYQRLVNTDPANDRRRSHDQAMLRIDVMRSASRKPVREAGPNGPPSRPYVRTALLLRRLGKARPASLVEREGKKLDARLQQSAPETRKQICSDSNGSTLQPYRNMAKILRDRGERAAGRLIDRRIVRPYVKRMRQESEAERRKRLNVFRFNPQPYQQMAKVLREQGDEMAARQIDVARMRLEAHTRISTSLQALAEGCWHLKDRRRSAEQTKSIHIYRQRVAEQLGDLTAQWHQKLTRIDKWVQRRDGFDEQSQQARRMQRASLRLIARQMKHSWRCFASLVRLLFLSLFAAAQSALSFLFYLFLVIPFRILRVVGRALWELLYGIVFDYCLSVNRAILALVICYVAGWIGIAQLNQHHYLYTNYAIMNAITPASAGHRSPPQGSTSTSSPKTQIYCDNQINDLLYAVETFTPLIRLHQTGRCDIRPPTPKEPSILAGFGGQQPGTITRWLVDHAPTAPRAFEYLKAGYELAGYIIWSLALLTFSGIPRRWDH